MCALSFQEELLYWGIAAGPPGRLLQAPTCRRSRKLRRDGGAEDEDDARWTVKTWTARAPEEEGRFGPLQLRGCATWWKGQTRAARQGVRFLSVCSFVTVTAVNLSISTLPSLREEGGEEQVRALPLPWGGRGCRCRNHFAGKGTSFSACPVASSRKPS